MKIYYYFLFRIYRFYTDTLGEDKALLFSTSGISSITLWFNLETIYTSINLISGNVINSAGHDIYIELSSLIILWFINDLLFVRPKKFLEQNFRKYWVYDLCILGYLIVTIVSVILVANYNRVLLGV